MELSADKKQLLLDLVNWYREHYRQADYLTIGGFAGTGKTTLIALFRQILFQKNPKLKVAFAAYTGKATQVLKTKLALTKTQLPTDFVGTIHSLIYSPIIGSGQQIIGWDRKAKLEFDLIIIDEASMVDQTIWADLSSYQLPIIAVGDHGQLPPINGSFNLMANPDYRLETIHRQLEDNPIIQLSILARTKGQIPIKKYSNQVIKIDRHSSEAQEMIDELLQSYQPDQLFLTGYNTTRQKINQAIRQSLEFTSPDPESGDRVICLRNNHRQQIFNGMLGTLQSITDAEPEWYLAKINLDDRPTPFAGLIAKAQFNAKSALNFTNQRAATLKGDLFDFGYALTVHKAQGSQARRIILFEERFRQMDELMWRRWLYTAVTRAEEELYIFGN